MPNAVAYVKAFRKTPRLHAEAVGPAQLPRGQPLQDDPPARSSSRRCAGADVWLTETGGLVRRNNAQHDRHPRGRDATPARSRAFSSTASCRATRAIKAVYLYHWNAGPLDTTWDSGLITPSGRERTALYVLRRVLTLGLRPTSSFRSPR